MRRVPSRVPAGSCGRICPAAALTSCSAAAMSAPQSKVIAISALPRLVVERTSRTPRTRRTASSTGVVTSIAIWSAGRSPASSVICTRGKATLGNSATGIHSALAMPPSASISARNNSERRCRCIHAVTFTGPTPAPHRHRQFVGAEHDHPGLRIERALHADGVAVRTAQRHRDALGMTLLDLEQIVAVFVVQHRAARHRPGAEIGGADLRLQRRAGDQHGAGVGRQLDLGVEQMGLRIDRLADHAQACRRSWPARHTRCCNCTGMPGPQPARHLPAARRAARPAHVPG